MEEYFEDTEKNVWIRQTSHHQHEKKTVFSLKLLIILFLAPWIILFKKAVELMMDKYAWFVSCNVKTMRMVDTCKIQSQHHHV